MIGVFKDLDDISQPDNGAQLSTGDGEMTDSDSELSAKEEDLDEDPPETPYVPNLEEEFGDVQFTLNNSLLCRNSVEPFF